MRNRFFPIFVPMRGRKILVVGGGSVALRRVSTLLGFGACVHVIAGEICRELMGLADRGALSCERKIIGRDRDSLILEQELGIEKELPFLALAATSDEELNRRIVQVCRSKGIWVNNASDKEECDFYFPAIVEKDGIVMGVSSQGESPARVRRICRRLREEAEL